MSTYEKLPELMGDIYDAALDSALWAAAIAKITDFVGGQAGGLISTDPVNKLGSFPYNCGMDPDYLRLYAERYSRSGPLLASLPPPGKIASISDLVTYDDYRRGQFYHEWARPQGWADAAYAVLEKSSPNCADVLCIIPSKANGRVDVAMRRRMALIAPHARRALLIGKSMDLKQTEAASFADTFDGLSAGMFLVDGEGRIVHANFIGHDMLYAADILRSADGRLATRDAQIDQNLREVFATCARREPIGTKAIALSLIAHDGERYVAHVLPLTSGARHAIGAMHAAVAAVFVRKAELGSPLDVVAQTYKLTPTELRVLLSIVDVGGVPETAVALGVAETTVKTHLYRLFDKAGVSRQADLVKLVAGFTNPLVG